jgi:N4-gp56 family major capsid protein
MPDYGVNVTGTDIPIDYEGYIRAELLATEEPNIIHSLFAVRDRVPFNSGQKINYTRAVRLATAVDPLAEGIGADHIRIEVVTTTLTMDELGNQFAFSSKMAKHSPVLVTNSHIPLLATNWAETIDLIVVAALWGCTNVFRADAVASDGLIAKIVQAADLERIEAALIVAKAREVTEYIAPNDSVGTLPVDPGFVGFAHPHPKRDLEKITNFIRRKSYPDQSKVIPGEFGSYNRIRFAYSQLADNGQTVQGVSPASAGLYTNNSGNNTAVYRIPIVGAEAYASVAFSDVNPTHDADYSATGSGSQNRAQAVGWTFDHAAGILEHTFMALYKAGASN